MRQSLLSDVVVVLLLVDVLSLSVSLPDAVSTSAAVSSDVLVAVVVSDTGMSGGGDVELVV